MVGGKDYNIGEVMTILRDNTQILEAVNSELGNLVELGDLRRSTRGVSVVYMLP